MASHVDGVSVTTSCVVHSTMRMLSLTRAMSMSMVLVAFFLVVWPSPDLLAALPQFQPPTAQSVVLIFATSHKGVLGLTERAANHQCLAALAICSSRTSSRIIFRCTANRARSARDGSFGI